MEYCIVEDGVIVNIIVSEANFAAEIGAQPSYDGAAIGGAYNPPEPEPDPPTLEERVDALEEAVSGGASPAGQISTEALASMFYVSRLTLAGETVDTDDKRIRASGLYEDWTAGKYAVGDIRNAEGQTWECFQAHDNTVYPDIKPGAAAWGTFWRPLHGKSRETARPFVAVQGAHDMYRAGEWMIWTDGDYYECLSDTNFSPTDNPSAWAKRA